MFSMSNKRSIGDLVDLIQNKNRKRDRIARRDRKKNKKDRMRNKVFKVVKPILYDFDPDIRKEMTIKIPSEYMEGIEHSIKIVLSDSKLKMRCDCQRLFVKKGKKFLRTNCKHISAILYSMMHNYFPKEEPTSVIGVIRHLNKKRLIVVDMKDKKFRSWFIKAYKKLTENHKFPEIIGQVEQTMNLPLKSGQVIKLSCNGMNVSASCECPINGQSNIEGMLIDLIRDFIFSFRPKKKKKKRAGTKKEDEELSKIFESLCTIED